MNLANILAATSFINVIEQTLNVHKYVQLFDDKTLNLVDSKFDADISLNVVQIIAGAAAGVLAIAYTALSFVPTQQYAVALATVSYLAAAVNTIAAVLQVPMLDEIIDQKDHFGTARDLVNNKKYADA
jgi:predicted membrane protein